MHWRTSDLTGSITKPLKTFLKKVSHPSVCASSLALLRIVLVYRVMQEAIQGLGSKIMYRDPVAGDLRAQPCQFLFALRLCSQISYLGHRYALGTCVEHAARIAMRSLSFTIVIRVSENARSSSGPTYFAKRCACCGRTPVADVLLLISPADLTRAMS